MNSTNLKLAWHFYCQEYQSSHQRLMRWVQGILMLFIITLSQTSSSIQGFLQQNLDGLLGADVVLSQKQALSKVQFDDLQRQSTQVVVTQQITTTLTHNGQWQPAQLKAVGQDYPLQGELIVAKGVGDNGKVTHAGPSVGEVWLDTRLLSGLGIQLGEQLSIGSHTLLVTGILKHEPDRLMEGHSVAMRAMINNADMAALNFADDLIQYRYLIAAYKAQTQDVMAWQKVQLPAAQIYHKQGKHPLALFWQRTENYMGLASIILFFMAAIAIEQLAQVHIRKDKYFTAVCMSLGASKATGIQISVMKWLIGILLLLPIVLLASTAANYLIIQFLNDTFSQLTWQFKVLPLLQSVCAVIAIFSIFHMPIWFSLLTSSVAEQFGDKPKPSGTLLNKLASFVVLFLVAFIYSDNGLLTVMMVSAVLITIALIVAISWACLTLGEKATVNVTGLMPFALFMMKQRLVSKSTQILGVGLCAFLLLFTLMLLRDLGNTMSHYQRQHDGNLFVSQASSEQMQFVEEWASDNAIAIRSKKPYFNAKLTEINAVSLDDYTDKPSDSLATMSRAIRLHWSQNIPANNRLDTGRWWQASDMNWQQVSVEEEVMTDLGLSLGDQLTFMVHQQAYQFEIVASHVYQPGAGSITFWVQMPPAAIEHIVAPHYYMASLELADAQWQLLTPLWQQFPTLRMVSLRELTSRFDKTLAMITQVISGFALFISLLAFVVIMASIKAVEPKEKKKNSIILSFGFTRKTCFALNAIEWLVTSSITAIGAVLGTYFAGQLIYKAQFSLNYVPNFIWLFMTLFIILLVITSLGLVMSRKQLNSSVRSLLASD